MGSNNIQCFNVCLITKVNIYSEGEGSNWRKDSSGEQIQSMVSSSSFQFHVRYSTSARETPAKSVSGQWEVQQCSYSCTSEARSISKLSLTLCSSLMDDVLTKPFPHCNDLRRRAWLSGELTIKLPEQGDCSCLEF